MGYMESLNFSRRPDPAPDGLFGRRRPRLLPEASARRQGLPTVEERLPQPLSPAELVQIARAWRRRGDGASIRVAETLESLAARRAPPPPPTRLSRPASKSVVRRISEFMGL